MSGETDKNNPSEEWSDDLLPRKPKLDDQEGTFMPNIEPSKPEINQSPEIKPEQTQESIQQQKKSHKGLIILLIVLVILLALGVGGFFAYQKYSSQMLSLLHIKTEEKKEEQKTEEKKEEIKETDTQIVEDMKKKIVIAKSEVAKKYPDANLQLITVIEGDSSVNEWLLQQRNLDPKGSYYFFQFSSLQYKNYNTVTIKTKLNENKIIKTEEQSSGSMIDSSSLPLDKIKISYKKALEIANKNGLKEFKVQNSFITQKDIGLFQPYSDIKSRSKVNYVSWGIQVSGRKSKLVAEPGHIIAFNIDAENGSIRNKYTK